MTHFIRAICSARLIAIALLIISVGGGIYAFNKLPVDAFPDVSPSLVQVFTETEGLAPEEVERYVTFPVETAMSGLPKLERIRSVSNFGLSVVNIYFEDGTDVYFARQVVAERLSEAREAIPEGFGEPVMGPISSGLGIILYFKLEDETGTRDLVEMREIQDWIIKFQLQTVPGVTEVLSLGGYEKQYQVQVDPAALLRYDVTIPQIVEALKRGNRTEGAQFINIGAEQFTVRGVGLAHSITDLEDTIVRSEDGTPVRIRDVAKVVTGGGVRQGLATSNGEGEVVAALTLKLYGENTSDVISRVRERFDQINASLPDGVKAIPYYDQAALVDRASTTVITALWQGALLVAVVIVAFLGGWRPSLVVVMSIPFSVGFAFIAMYALGIGANLMTLGGVAIAIGMMVDGAIVITENVDRFSKEQPDRTMSDIVTLATAEVIAPLAAAVIVVIVVFLPLFALQGVEGKTFRPLAASAALAMTGSLIYAVFIAPALAALAMRSHRSKRQDPSAPSRIARTVRRAASPFMAHRWLAFALAGCLLVLGGVSASRLGSEFTPALEEGDILLRLTMAPSISLDEASATTTRVEKALLANFPEIETIVSRIGRGEVGAHADPTNSAEAFVALKPRSEWRKGLTPQSLRDALSEFLEQQPGIVGNVGQPIAMSVDELITGARAELAIKIFGPNTDVLIEKSALLQSILKTMDGVADLQVDQVTGAPQLVVQVDRKAIGRYGLTVEDALDALRAGVGGVQAGLLFEGVRQFPIMVRYREQDRSSIDAIRRVILTSPSGEQVPLEAVARVETVIGPRQITREDGERFITVQTNVRGRDIGSFVEEGRSLVANRLDLPPGYRIAWGGQFELQEQANKRFALVIPITLGIVFFILLLTYGRLKSALLILINIPFALTGGAIALWLAGLPMSVPSTVGFIALFGIALGNGMVLVSFMDGFALRGRNADELALDAAALRARPVLMTAMTTALGLAPLLFASGVGAEVQRPLAVVVTGGLFTSCLLTLLVLPSLHKWFAPLPAR